LSKDVPDQKKPAPKRKKPAPKDEARRAVSTAVTERMRELGFTVAEISRRTGLSETTIHGVIQVTSRPAKSTLALLSAVLSWRINHLYNILYGRAHENVTAKSPLEEYLVQVVDRLAVIDTLQEDVSEVKGIVRRINGKIDAMIAGPQVQAAEEPSQGGPRPRGQL
jgi:hypothetical protein